MYFEIYTIPADVVSAFEPGGTKEKFWFTDPRDDCKYLFKIGRVNTGENWAEKIASELCALLDIPHAHYDLASFDGKQGIICKNFAPSPSRLILGNELLSKILPGYARQANYSSRLHTLRIIQTLLKTTKFEIKPPLDWTPPQGETFHPADIFTGYLMLDTLISNQDRHHENWGLVVSSSPTGDSINLTPTYDHGASLGMNETDQKRYSKLNTTDVGNSIETYVCRSRSAIYHTKVSGKPLMTIEAFGLAALSNRLGASYWLNQLEQLSFEDIERVVNKVPSIIASSLEKEFALAIIKANIGRLMKLKSDMDL